MSTLALASVELNIGPHPIASLVGELNPWLQAERNQGRQLKWISLGLPGIWLHSQPSSAVCGSSRSPGKPSVSSSCEPFSMQPQHQQPPDHCHPPHVLSSDGKDPLEPGCPGLALTAIKGEPNTLLKPSSLKNADRKRKEPPYSFCF